MDIRLVPTLCPTRAAAGVLTATLALVLISGCALEHRDTPGPGGPDAEPRISEGELVVNERAFCQGRDGIELYGPDPVVLESDQGGERPPRIYKWGSASDDASLWAINCSDRPLEISRLARAHDTGYEFDRSQAMFIESGDSPSLYPEVIFDLDDSIEIPVYESVPVGGPQADGPAVVSNPFDETPGRSAVVAYCDGGDESFDYLLGREYVPEPDDDELHVCGAGEFRVTHPAFEEALEQCCNCNGRIRQPIMAPTRGEYLCNCEALDAGRPCEEQNDCEGACLEIRQTLADEDEPAGRDNSGRYCSARQYFSTGCVITDSTYRVDRCSSALPEGIREDFGCE